MSYTKVRWHLQVVLALLWAVLVGCAPQQVRRVPVRVEVPVKVIVLPPAEMLQPYQPNALPQWVAPSDPAASSALTPEGERRLKEMLLEYRRRDLELQAWGAAAKENK